jgi:predicted ArsR family transcriptional regulator
MPAKQWAHRPKDLALLAAMKPRIWYAAIDMADELIISHRQAVVSFNRLAEDRLVDVRLVRRNNGRASVVYHYKRNARGTRLLNRTSQG